MVRNRHHTKIEDQKKLVSEVVAEINGIQVATPRLGLPLDTAIEDGNKGEHSAKLYIATCGVLNNIHIKPKTTGLHKAAHVAACKLCCKGLQELNLWAPPQGSNGDTSGALQEVIPRDLAL